MGLAQQSASGRRLSPGSILRGILLKDALQQGGRHDGTGRLSWIQGDFYYSFILKCILDSGWNFHTVNIIKWLLPHLWRGVVVLLQIVYHCLIYLELNVPWNWTCMIIYMYYLHDLFDYPEKKFAYEILISGVSFLCSQKELNKCLNMVLW